MDSNAVIERANRLGFSDSINYRLLCGDIVIYQDGTYKIFPFSVEKEIHKLWKAGLTDSEKEEAKGYISRKIRKEKEEAHQTSNSIPDILQDKKSDADEFLIDKIHLELFTLLKTKTLEKIEMLNSGKLKLTKQHYESLQNAIAFVKMRWDRETLLQFQTIIGPKVCKHCDGSGKVSIGTTLDKRLELRVSDICRGIIMGREMKTLDRNTNLRDFI